MAEISQDVFICDMNFRKITFISYNYVLSPTTQIQYTNTLNEIFMQEILKHKHAASE